MELDTISPTAAVLALAAGLVSIFVSGGSAGTGLKILTFLATTVVAYFIFAKTYGD